ncbi:MAG: hypothetical protein ACJARR_001317 [Pseudophaeobacter arcticus]|jgi:hypothetical protein
MRTKLPLEMVCEAAHRRAVVRESDLSDWQFVAAKHILTTCQTLQKPNRRAGGRPGDARRPSALNPRR